MKKLVYASEQSTVPVTFSDYPEIVSLANTYISGLKPIMQEASAILSHQESEAQKLAARANAKFASKYPDVDAVVVSAYDRLPPENALATSEYSGFSVFKRDIFTHFESIFKKDRALMISKLLKKDLQNNRVRSTIFEYLSLLDINNWVLVPLNVGHRAPIVILSHPSNFSVEYAYVEQCKWRDPKDHESAVSTIAKACEIDYNTAEDMVTFVNNINQQYAPSMADEIQKLQEPAKSVYDTWYKFNQLCEDVLNKVKRAVPEKKPTWSQIKNYIENSTYNDPIYEGKDGGEVLEDMIGQAANSLDITIEPSIQNGRGSQTFYDADDNVIGECDYQDFNQDIIDIALQSSNKRECQSEIKKYIESLI